MPSTRRDFLKQAGGVAAAAGAAATTASAARPAWAADAAAKPKGANERFVMAVIGPGGQGLKVMKTLVETKDVEVAWVCDVDGGRLDAAAQELAEMQGGATRRTTKDMRRVFDDKDVDDVVLFVRE